MKEVDMDFQRAASTADIPPGKMKAVKLEGKEILLANVGGNFHAIANKCTHAHAPLSRGRLEDCVITCPLHHAKFDVTTGKNLSDAKILFLKMKAGNTEVFQVKVEGNDVLVSVG
jgi:3-phenylpropionate/trans-cinnamate dioxygenase ferredoxin subunit